jgi:hypothetical protein
MEFLTIHELSRLSGVSTATIRLDIKAGKLPVAAPGRKGRGNPTRIKISDLQNADRILYQQLARQFLQHGPKAMETFEKSSGKLSVNELAVRTGLSPQVVRKDIVDGKLKAGGGGRRGSPYYVLMEDLADAKRAEYRRLVDSHRSSRDNYWEVVQQEISQLKQDMEFLKERLQIISSYLESTLTEPVFPVFHGSRSSLESSAVHEMNGNRAPNGTTAKVPIHMIILPTVFTSYYVSEEKVRQLKAQVQNKVPLEPVIVRLQESGDYLLRKGIAQYHVAKELGMAEIAAIIEEAEDAAEQ